MKLFFGLPYCPERVQVVGLNVPLSEVRKIANCLQEKFGDDPRFMFVPPLEQQIKKAEEMKDG